MKCEHGKFGRFGRNVFFQRRIDCKVADMEAFTCQLLVFIVAVDADRFFFFCFFTDFSSVRSVKM